MNHRQVLIYLEELERRLFDKTNRRPIALDLPWINSLEHLSTAGAYLIFEDETPCYVGETGNLKKRMNDLRNTKNHSFRRSMGHKHFGGHAEFFKATSSKSFHPDIEILLRNRIMENFRVSLVPVKLGRKELEEHICNKYGLMDKYNIKSKRK